MADLIAVRLPCLALLPLPDWQRHHLRALAERVEGDVAIYHPGHASYAQFAVILEGCRGEMPTAAATAGVTSSVYRPPPLRPGFPAYTGYDGRARWGELHTELYPSPATVERVIVRVCPACRDRARALLTRIPPRFGTLDDYRRWGVAYHDAVNVEIGNAVFGWDAAVKKYGY